VRRQMREATMSSFVAGVALLMTLTRVVAAQSAPPRKDIPSIAKAANGSIVSIVMSDDSGKPIAQGTGFIVNKGGLVVTNYHVIAEGSSGVAKLTDGAIYILEGVVTSDKARDVAVLKIKATGKNFRGLMLGNSDRVEVGQEVVAIGNPLSLESTVSNGIVSGIRTADALGGKFLQVTAPISPGSSGGPLFNMAGEVIGITTLYLKGGENLNFAIPINDAKRLLLNPYAKWGLEAVPVWPNVTEPGDNAGDSHDAENSATQKTCDARAEKLARYESQGYGKAPLKIGYVAHYDAKANRCYVETAIDLGDGKDPRSIAPNGLKVSGKFYVIRDALIDGNESPLYGEFLFHEDGVRWLGGECEIYLQGGTPDNSYHPKIKCRSEEEFNDLAQRYFGIARPPNTTIAVNSPKW
jgi:hypothetical protein